MQHSQHSKQNTQMTQVDAKANITIRMTGLQQGVTNAASKKKKKSTLTIKSTYYSYYCLWPKARGCSFVTFCIKSRKVSYIKCFHFVAISVNPKEGSTINARISATSMPSLKSLTLPSCPHAWFKLQEVFLTIKYNIFLRVSAHRKDAPLTHYHRHAQITGRCQRFNRQGFSSGPPASSWHSDNILAPSWHILSPPDSSPCGN